MVITKGMEFIADTNDEVMVKFVVDNYNGSGLWYCERYNPIWEDDGCGCGDLVDYEYAGVERLATAEMRKIVGERNIWWDNE